MRGAGLQHGGEFSVENVLYKDRRNRGLLDKLNAKIHKV
jgi:aminoglycoside phosphotransferase (APT) family kinase protein